MGSCEPGQMGRGKENAPDAEFIWDAIFFVDENV